MTADPVLLDRAVPDVVDTATLSPVLAAEIDHLAGRWERWVAPGPHHLAITARALMDAGRFVDARALLEAAEPGPTWPTHALTAAARTASRTGPVAVASRAASLLEGAAGSFLLDGDVPLGPRSLFVGLARAAEGDEAAAAEAFADAVAAGDLRAPVWGALARAEAARSALGGADVDPRGHRLATTAGLFFRAGGYRHLAAQLDGLVDGGVLPGPHVAAPGHPGTGRLVAPAADPGMGRGAWCVGYGVAPAVEVTGSKGLVVLAHLLGTPRAVPAVELDAVASGHPVAEVHRRLAEAGSGLTELVNDDVVRSRVTKLIRRTIARLGEVHPVLGRHLGGHVETGYVCGYRGVHARWRR